MAFDYPLGTAGTLVNERFNESKNIGESAYQVSLNVINSLQTIVQALQLIDQTISIDSTTISPAEISATPPTIDLDNFRVDMPALPTEPTIVSSEIGTLPDFPTLATGELQIPNETYVSSLLTAIKSKLLNDIANGSVGIPDAIQDAMFQRDYERSILEEKDLEDSIAAEWSSRGFPLPNGALIAGIDQAKINFANKRLDVSRDIMMKAFELALVNYHFIIQQGIALESQLMGYAHSVAQLAFQVADETIKNAIAAFRERREVISAKILSILETAKTKIQYNVSLIKMFTAKLEAYSAKIKGEGDRVNAVARGIEAEVNLFQSVAKFDVSRAELDLKVIEARIGQMIANQNLLIKDKEIEMKNYEVFNTLKIEVAKAIAQVLSVISAGAYAGVSAAAHITRTDSGSLVETHSYQEE
jgi:hypothetical protein